MNSNEFYNELKQLTELGYLEQAQLDRIQDEYMESRKEHRSVFLIFALIGVIFIGAGVVSMFAYNWSMFPKEVKALIAFLPVLGVQGILYWKIRVQASDVWIKSLTLALGIAFLSAMGLIYQAYQISYSLQSMMLTGFIVMLPVVYLLDGYYLAILYIGGICWVGGNNDYILLILLLAPYYLKRVMSNRNSWLLSLCFFIWLLYVAILYVDTGALYACLLILLIDMTIENPGLYRKLAGRLLYILLFMQAVFYGSIYMWAVLFKNDPAWDLSNPILPALIAGALIRIFIFLRKNSKKEQLHILLYSILCGLLLLSLSEYGWNYGMTYEVIVNLFLIAFSLYKLLCGIREANLPSVRRYTAAVILYIVLKVSFGNYQLLVKGIVFIIAGISFLIANYMMTKKLKGVKPHEKTPE